MTMRNPALIIFEQIKSAYAAEFLRPGLITKVGIVLDCAVIKLLKDHWTTSPHSIAQNSNGLFFSVWLEESKKPLLRYNLHAKKLREAGFPRIAAREFASSFRDKTRGELKSWPNIAYPKGPGTLFEGQKFFDLNSLATDTLDLMRSFVRLAPILDDLLPH